MYEAPEFIADRADIYQFMPMASFPLLAEAEVLSARRQKVTAQSNDSTIHHYYSVTARQFLAYSRELHNTSLL